MKIQTVLMNIMFRLFGAKGFGKTLISLENSKTYGVFCERVYGRNLCQLNMVDEAQLQKLLSVASLDASKTVLDLGCGAGIFTEFVSDVTGAKVTGVDFAKEAVLSASKRTAQKQDRLRFVTANINTLPSDLGTFDCIMSLDTLYFVKDLDETIVRLKDLLKPSGQLTAFYSARLVLGDQHKESNSETSRLGKALKKAGFKFQAWNFTSNEKRIWQLTGTVAEELKAEFTEEGNKRIYESRIAEGRRNLNLINQGLFERYLFHALK